MYSEAQTQTEVMKWFPYPLSGALAGSAEGLAHKGRESSVIDVQQLCHGYRQGEDPLPDSQRSNLLAVSSHGGEGERESKRGNGLFGPSSYTLMSPSNPNPCARTPTFTPNHHTGVRASTCGFQRDTVPSQAMPLLIDSVTATQYMLSQL